MFKFLVKLGTLLIFSVLISSCGSSSSNSSDVYQGKGSTWEMTFNAGTVTGSESVSGVTFSGTYTSKSTGFIEVTVTSSSGTGAPTVGTEFYGITIPEVAVVFRPILTSGESVPVVLLKKGTCPSGTGAFSWIEGQPNSNYNVNDSNAEVYGKFTTTNSGNTVTVNTGYSLANNDTNLTSGQSFTGTCSDGKATVGSGQDSGTMFYTASGPIMIHTSNGLIYGVPSATVTASNLAGDYSGIIYTADGSTLSDKFHPALMTINSTGTSGSVTIYDTVETTATSLGTATLALSSANSPHAGAFKGTVTVGGSTENSFFAVVVNIAGTGINAVFGIGRKPGAATKAYSTLFVSKVAASTFASGNIFESVLLSVKRWFKF